MEKVDLLGDQDPKIYVDFSQRKFAELGIGFPQLAAALQGQNTIAPAGQLNTPQQAIDVRIDGSYDSVQQIEDTRFRVNGRSLRLGDFAQVYRGFVDPPVSKIRHRGHEAIALGVVMQQNADVLEVGKALHAQLEQMHGTFPVGIEAEQVTDQRAAAGLGQGAVLGGAEGGY